MRAARRLSLSLLLLLLLTACLGSSGGGEEETLAGPIDTGLDLSAVSLAATEAPQMQTIEVLGLPEAVGSRDLYAAFQPADAGTHPLEATDDRRAALLTTEDGQIVVVTPFVDAEGGDIELVITDGDSRSAVFELTLASLPPPATGRLQAIVNSFDAVLAASVEAMGWPYPDELIFWRDREFHLMPESLLPLMQVWLAIVDDGNPGSLAARLDAMPAEERELIERVLAQQDLVPLLGALVAMIDSGDSLLGTVEGVTEFPSLEEQAAPPAPQSVTTMTIAGEDAHRLDGSFLHRIDDPETLAQRMEEYANARALQQSMDNFNEVFGAYVMVAGLMTGGVASGLAGLVTVANKVADATGSVAEVARWFMPCCIREVNAELDPPDGRISFEDAEPNQVALDSLQVTVESEGFDLAREVVDRVWNRILEKDVKPDLKEHFGDSAGDLIAGQAVNPAMGAYLDRFNGDALVFVWQEIELVDETPRWWINHELDTFAGFGDPIVEHDASLPPAQPSPYEFRLKTPEAFQEAQVRTLIRFKPDREVFPQGHWSSIVVDTREIDLEHIEVNFEPPVVQVAEGESVTFEIHVENAVDSGLSQPLRNGPGLIHNFTDLGDGRYSLEFDAPDAFPEGGAETIIEAHATSQAGIRSDEDAPIRSGRAVILMGREEEEEEDEEDEDEHVPGELVTELCPDPDGDPLGPVWEGVQGMYFGEENWNVVIGDTTLEYWIADPSDTEVALGMYYLSECRPIDWLEVSPTEQPPDSVGGWLFRWSHEDHDGEWRAVFHHMGGDWWYPQLFSVDDPEGNSVASWVSIPPVLTPDGVDAPNF